MKEKVSSKLVALVFSSLAILFLTAFYLFAWTEPSQAPPGGNVAAPVNVGSATQYKSGALGIGGLFRVYSDAIFDGKVGIGTTGPGYKLDVNGSMAATILYDKDNAGYYVDPSGTTRLNAVKPNIIPITTGDSPNAGYSHYAIYEQPGAWTYPYPDLMIEYHTGISYIAYYGYGGHRFYTGYNPDASPNTLAFSVGEFDNNTRVYNNLYVSGTAYANGQALCQANGTNCLAGSTNADTVDWLHASSFRQFNVWQNNHYSGTDGAEYATIYYDANNSGYYVDPSGSSRMNQLYYVDSAYIVDLRPQYMYDWNDPAYYIDMNNTSRLNYLGRNYGWNWTEYDWNNTAYYMDLDQTSRLNRLDFRYGYDMDNTGYYIDLNNTTRANEIQANRVYGFADIRSPIFYDYNNTGYYVDPNSTSRINYGVFDNIYSYSWIAGPIFYDNNDWGYYLDPNGTSRMNVATANTYNCASDINLKENLQKLDNPLGKIMSLEGMSFIWKNTGKASMGFTAQDVEKVFPELVSTNAETGLKSVQYDGLIAPLVEALKEQQKEIDGLNAKIDKLMQRIEELESGSRR